MATSAHIRSPSPDPSETGSWTSTVVAGSFKMPGLPASASRAPQAPPLNSSVPSTTLQLPIRQLDNDTKVGEWLGGVDDKHRPSNIYTKYAKKKVTFADETDNEDSPSEATIRPGKSASKAVSSKITTSIVSDADYPTVVEDSSDDGEGPVCIGKVLIRAKARDWVWRAHHAPTKAPQPWWVDQKTNLMIIERHWGGSIEHVIPDDLRPHVLCATLPGKDVRSYQDPMEWDKNMAVKLRKIAARCSLQDFIAKAREHLSAASSLGLRLRGVDSGLVDAFYIRLKHQEIQPRSLEDVANEGPNVGIEGALFAGSKTSKFFFPVVPRA